MYPWQLSFFKTLPCSLYGYNKKVSLFGKKTYKYNMFTVGVRLSTVWYEASHF